MDRKLILAVAALVLALPAWPGEIIGNTFIGEKYGYIEIQSPDGKWDIEDREGRGGTNFIANLRLKDQINGTRPYIEFRGIPHAYGVTLDQVMQASRDSMVKQGVETSPIEPRRFSGKQALAYTFTFTQANISGKAYVILLEGPKTYFLVLCGTSAVAYDAAKPLFDEVIERLKY